MAAYEIESDRTFLRCKEVGVLELYEIDNKNVVPVQEKHLNHIGTICLGHKMEHEALKIGDKEIRGRNLLRVMHDLISLRMMVNREGLCLLETEGVVSKFYEVDYFRMFDLFDWSNYHVETSIINTTWVRSDIVEGRPILDCYTQSLSKMEAELKEEKRKNAEEMQKKQNEIEEMKRRYKEEIRKYDEIEEEKRRLIEEMGKKQDEIENEKRKHMEEIQWHQFKLQEMELNNKIRETIFRNKT